MKERLYKLAQRPVFYAIAGFAAMTLVILIARTSLFYLCYLPVILASKYTSSDSFPAIGKVYPPKFVRIITFVAGLIVAELLFAVILIAEKELSFPLETTHDNWIVVAVELTLAISVYVVFFGIAVLLRKLFSKARPS